MPKIFSTIVELLRLDKPVGYLLVFFPALFGLFLAYEEPIDLYYIPVLFVGSVLARSSGCVINDFFDRDFDRQVLRTKNRPLANNTISTELALIILGLLLLLTMWTLLYFTIIPIIIGIIAFCMIVIYPLMKRFTYFPQVFLGLTFNLGCLISYAEIKDDISVGAFLMYIACGFWTFGYDSIYAFMDIKDDKSIGVKSSAIFLKDKNYKLFILCAYIIFMVLYVVANLSTNNYLGLIGGAIALFVLFWQVKSLDVTDPANCLIRFKSNVYVGFIMAFSMLLGCILN
ncbi:MAG: 4-hydroxybenzoate octaprenyltransferase [Rickettsiaceae bacterium]|jgi:4-hydroxybenzoate polyprenyltransferase|nr:4-hydroxybenzoate octaprenyltransferase [Rickettsiaceae bacterium]